MGSAAPSVRIAQKVKLGAGQLTHLVDIWPAGSRIGPECRRHLRTSVRKGHVARPIHDTMWPFSAETGIISNLSTRERPERIGRRLPVTSGRDHTAHRATDGTISYLTGVG